MILLEDKKKIAVIGGDERQLHCAMYFADAGYETAIYGFESFMGDIGLCTKATSLCDALNGCGIVVLPINVGGDENVVFSPFSNSPVTYKNIIENMGENCLVFMGKATENIKLMFAEGNISLYDYFEREELIVANAYLTAESAVAIALNSCKESILDMSVLVMGYGRIGKMLCRILKGFGVNVYASARKKKDFEWIRAYGYSPVDTSRVCDIVSGCGVIFNTIPNLVLSEKELHCLPKDCLIIDLASKPGGIDFEAAKNLGLRVVWALALPGKYKPVSAGKVIAKTIFNIIEDEVKI